jgi:molybdenum cofactor biosynthesis enzyme MoaA
MGCLSLQKNSDIPHSQDRIAFTPSPQEIAEVALAHIRRVSKGVVSFGQGCEGDPLLADKVIEPAIRQIREKTLDGTINMNTNGSLPGNLNRLFDAGLDSVRISMNSVREKCYDAYFRPQGYRFANVLNSIDTALAHDKFVAINYLNCPGFSDSPEEVDALVRFLENHPIHMIQWRNLNFDPIRYWKEMDAVATHSISIGMENLLNRVRRQFPELKFGYFNPPKESFGKN